MNFQFLSPQPRSQNKKITLDPLTIPVRKERKVMTNLQTPKMGFELKINLQGLNNGRQLMKQASKTKLKPLTFSQMKAQLNLVVESLRPQQQQQEESEEQSSPLRKESILQKLPKKSILGLRRMPSIRSDVRSSLKSVTESDSVEDGEVSVVWNDDDLKVRGFLPQIQEEKPVNQFMKLYKYRFESYPNMKQPIENSKVLHAARAYAKMNRRAWKKYFGGQEVEFEDEKNYAEGYNPFKDNNFTQFWDYIERTRKVPRVLNEARLKETLQISHLQERPSSKRNNFAIRSSIFKQQY